MQVGASALVVAGQQICVDRGGVITGFLWVHPMIGISHQLLILSFPGNSLITSCIARKSSRITMEGCWKRVLTSPSSALPISCKQHVCLLARSTPGRAAWRASRQRLQQPCELRRATHSADHRGRDSAGGCRSCSCSDEATSSTSLFPPSKLQYRHVSVTL